MTEYLRNNPVTLRSCILYEFIEGKPVYESFKNMCKRIGNDVIDYVDFEYWFMRFANGKFDLNHDRSLDPKTRSLSDMPIHIFEKVVNNLDSNYRFVIRRVSKNFQYIIDSGNPVFKKIRIQIGERKTYLYYDDKCVAYTYPRRNKKNIKNGDCVVENTGIVIQSLNHLKVALNDLSIVLRNPTLQLDEFHVDYLTEKFSEQFESMLKSSNREIHVKKVTIKSPNPHSAMKILSYLEARTLKEIVLDTCSRDEIEADITEMMDRLVELEQYKSSEMLTIITDNRMDSFPIERFLECSHFTIQFNCDTFETTMLQFIKTLLESTVLEVATFKMSPIYRCFCFFDILKQLGRRAIEVPDRPNARRLPIPESNEFFEIVIQGFSVCIERTF